MRTIKAAVVYVLLVVAAVYLLGFLVGCSTTERDPFELSPRAKARLKYEIIRDTCKARGEVLYCSSRGATSHTRYGSCGCMRKG